MEGSGRCLPCGHEDQCPASKIHRENRCRCTRWQPQPWEGGDTLFLGLPGRSQTQMVKSRFGERSCLKTQGGKQLRKVPSIDLSPTHAHAHT